MKVSRLLSFGAVCVATTAFLGALVVPVAAYDSELSTDAVLASKSVLETPGSALDLKDACVEKGFDAETLDCRVCNMLALTLSLQLGENASEDAVLAEAKQRATEDAVATCQRCCTDVEAIDGLAQSQKYARVVLEVCTCKFGRLPKIANFVNNHAAQHARLEVKYINARMPYLLFYDDDGEKKEEISIASWDEETISEFIKAKLKKQEDEPVEEASTTEDNATEGEDATEEQNDAIEEDSDDSNVAAAEEGDSDDSEDVVEVEVSAETQ